MPYSLVSSGDVLRPIIIREKSVDELCRVINTLVEDVRSQMLAIHLPKPILRTMLVALDLTVSDAQVKRGDEIYPMIYAKF